MATECPNCRTENLDDSKFCKECAAPLSSAREIEFSPTRTLEAPVRIIASGRTLAGKYRIMEPIGRGGMGVVYKAEDTKLKRTVAVKFLPSELTEDREAGERFVREAQAAAALSHPHICTIHEINEEEKQAFIVMEYIQGPSLKQKILQGPLDQAKALDIAIQAAEGLEEAHGKGIIHRDIKPGNIMVTDEGTAKIMDFGLAKVLGGSLITKEPKTMGTAAYMSPEQAQGQSVDHRTDIWSLGVVLFEMVAGQLPFGGDNEASLLFSVVHRAPRLIRKIKSETAPEMEKVIGKALEKNPSDRYQSMGELLEDLRALAEGMKPLRAKAGIFRGRILGIRKLYIYPAAIVILAALVSLGVFILHPGQRAVMDSIAILPLVNDSGDANQDYFANSLTELIINDLYKVAALNVASRQDVMRYKNSGKALKEIAGELNVKALVEASVLKLGDKVRLTARLIDPFRKNKILWADTMEREYSEILIMQSDLSQAIVSGIRATVTPVEKMRLATDRKVNPEAYDLYLKGLDVKWSAVSPSESYLEKYLRSIDYFQKAIDIDPTFAKTYEQKGDAYIQIAANGWANEKEAFLRAREAVLKALDLEAGLAEAQAILATVKLDLDWDFGGAEQEYRRALEFEPGNRAVISSYTEFLVQVGRNAEAINLLKRRIEEESKTGTPLFFMHRLAIIYLCAGRYVEALKELKNLMGPLASADDWSSISTLALVYAVNGLHSEALAHMEKIKDMPGARNDTGFCLLYAWILAVSGRREEALKQFEELKSLLTKVDMDPAYSSAAVYAGLGDKDKAFKSLDQAYKNHSTQMPWLLADWWFHSLHGDPRFEALLKKVGFPDVTTEGKQ